MKNFIGTNLRQIRLFHNKSLQELGQEVNVSKQFLSRVETGAEAVSSQLEAILAEKLKVLPEFFYRVDHNPIEDEQCHFRKQLTTKPVLRQSARARGEILKLFVNVLDERIELPSYKVKEADPTSAESIEIAAEHFRKIFGLGLGPLSNVTRIAENSGAVVFKIDNMAPEIDAISFATKRPLIALNASGQSACRERFGIAHELGHFALHIGVLTGDRITETQANRFSSSLLIPRSSFAKEYKLGVRGSRLSWSGLSELKLRWGVSKAAILFRGHQLGLFSEDQARSGYIYLKRHGEAIVENEDVKIAHESPELLEESLNVMSSHFGLSLANIADQMFVSPELLKDLLNLKVEEQPVKVNPLSNNVTSLFKNA